MGRAWNVGRVALMVLWAWEARAMPAFARLHQTACSTCHEGYPKLNVVGLRFKERGFRFDKEAFGVGRWLRSVPLSARGSVARETIDYAPPTSKTIKGVTAGALGNRISFWFDDTFKSSREYDVSRRQFFTWNRRQGIDNGWLRLEVLRSGRLHLRGGRFELDLPFSQARSPHLLPYEIYTSPVGYANDTLADFRGGLELGGTLPGEARWSVAVVKSRDRFGGPVLRVDPKNPLAFVPADTVHPQFFLRLSKGAARRFGAFAYAGRNTLAFNTGNASWEERFLWLGADANLWVKRFNLLGAAVHGRHADPLAYSFFPGREWVTVSAGLPLSSTAGLLQSDWHLRRFAALSFRVAFLHGVPRPAYSFREPPRSQEIPAKTTIDFAPGLHLWVRERLRLAFEVRLRKGEYEPYSDLRTKALWRVELAL